MSLQQPWLWNVLLCMLARLPLCLLHELGGQTQWDVTTRMLQGLNETSAPLQGLNETNTATGAFTQIFAKAVVLEPELDPYAAVTAQTMLDEDKATFSPVSAGAAWTLQGSLVFGMLLLYLVNWLDDDVRRYAWRVLSQTVAIFSAVLLEQTAEDQVFHFFRVHVELHEETEEGMLCVTFFMIIVFFMLLQLTTAYAAGLLGGVQEDDLDKENWVVENGLRSTHSTIVASENIEFIKWGVGVAMGEDGYPVFVKKRRLARESLERRMESWARLLTHCTAFVGIRFGLTLQNIAPFNQNWIMTVLAMLVHQVVLVLLFRILELLTVGIRKRHDSQTLVDFYEDHLWDSETTICALNMSALGASSIKFSISGVLANVDGRQPWRTVAADWKPTTQLMSAGWTCLLIGLGMTFLRGRGRAGHNVQQMANTDDGEVHGPLTKMLDIVQSSLVMTFPWCANFATRWAFISMWRMDMICLEPGCMLVAILVAVVISVAAFACTVLLDKVEDLEKWLIGEMSSTDMLFRNALISIGLTVGFAWDDAFDSALDIVSISASSAGTDASVIKMVASAMVVLLIIPAWRKYIVARELYYVDLKNDIKFQEFLKHEEGEEDLQQDGWFF